jgi:glycosyltransferase involved in cell wall biosynthesis
MYATRQVVVLGTSCRTRGGIAAVIAAHLAAGLATRWPVVHLATHADGSRWTKLRLAASALARFVGLILAGRVALVHVHSASDASFFRKAIFIAVALLARRPVIFQLHGGGFYDFYSKRCGPLRRLAVRFVLDRVARIVTLSEEGARRIAGITRNRRVSTIPNMVDTRALRSPPSRDPQGAELLFLGRLEPGKGIYELLEAAAQLRSRFPRLRLVLAGAGDEQAVATRAHALGIGDRIEFPGWVEGEGKVLLLRRASAFVLPSHVENMPVSVLEAMAAGLPVIATRVGALPELVEEGETGLLVPPRDARALAAAIETILSDPGLRARMGASARERAERDYSVERLMPKLETLYGALGAVERRAAGDKPCAKAASA